MQGQHPSHVHAHVATHAWPSFPKGAAVGGKASFQYLHCHGVVQGLVCHASSSGGQGRRRLAGPLFYNALETITCLLMDDMVVTVAGHLLLTHMMHG